MIRFAFALLIAVCLLGSVALCQYGLTRQINVRLTSDIHEELHPQEASAEGSRYTLALTPAFDVLSDPFALRLEDDAAPVRLLVREGTREVLRWTEDIQSGVTIRKEEVELTTSPAELYIEATPAADAARASCALRLQVFRGDVLMADETLWSEGDGAPIARRLLLVLEAERHTLDRGLGSTTSTPATNGDGTANERK